MNNIIPYFSYTFISNIIPNIYNFIVPRLDYSIYDENSVEDFIIKSDMSETINILEIYINQLKHKYENVNTNSKAKTNANVNENYNDIIIKIIKSLDEIISKIKYELACLNIKISHNRGIWIFKSLRSYNFTDSQTKLTQLLSILEKRTNSLFKFIGNNNLLSNSDNHI